MKYVGLQFVLFVIMTKHDNYSSILLHANKWRKQLRINDPIVKHYEHKKKLLTKQENKNFKIMCCYNFFIIFRTDNIKK